MSVDWNRKSSSLDPVRLEGIFRKRLIALMVIGGLGIGACVLGLSQLVRAASKNPPVVTVLSDGRAYYAVPEPFRTVTSALELHMEDILFVLFTRTEEPFSERLQYYCSPTIIRTMEGFYADLGRKYPSGYFQQAKILSAKLQDSYTNRLNLWFEVLIESRSESGAIQNTFFLDCSFIAGNPTAENPLGWRLNDLVRIDRSQYYADEIEENIRERTEIPTP